MDFISPDYAHSALVIVDYQNDCILPSSPYAIPGAFEVLPALTALTTATRNAGRPIVHIVRGYLPDGSNVDACRRQSVLDGSSFLRVPGDGADFPRCLKPTSAPPLDWPALLAGEVQRLGPHDHVIYKPRWGAFYQTPLEALLRAQAINTLIIAGCNFPNCPRTTIYEASERDFRLVVASDALSGLYTRGCQELAGIGVQLADHTTIGKIFTLFSL